MQPTRSLRSLLAVLGLSALACAQGAASALPPTGFGVGFVDGIVRASGPDYTARFDARGVEFVPVLGQCAEQSKAMPVRFTLESVRRGSANSLTRSRDAAPAVEGNRVSYAHGDGLIEVYDARVDGVEQSFVFASRPVGSGDLIVRGAITTELPLAAASDDGVRYELPGIGGVTFGAVTGIDANGDTARGSIRAAMDGSHVEWVLPAAFVDHAAYPLVLDPLIGAAIAIGNIAGGDDVRPSVAFDDSTDRYLVVWNVTPASGSSEVRGQFVTASGAVLGGGFLIANGTVSRQAVASVNGTDRFVVAYTTTTTVLGNPVSTSIFVRSVDASSGAVSNAVLVESIGTSAGSVGAAVVGGDSRPQTTAQSAMLLYQRTSVGFTPPAVMARLVNVPSAGDPIATGAASTAVGTGSGVRVTAHGGPSRRWLATWLVAPLLGAPLEVYAGVVGSTASLCAPVISLFTAAPGDTLSTPVSASPDGTTFFVAWSDTNGVAEDVRGVVAAWSGACGSGTLTPGALLSPVSTAGLQDEPAVAFAKDKFVLAWRNRTTPTSTSRVFVKGLDPVTCAPCGAEWSVDNTLLGLEAPAIAARHTAGDTASDEALVVWSNTAIRGRLFEARGNDVVTSMGGACSVSGLSDYASYDGDCVIGNADFELVLAAPVSLPLVVIVGFSSISAPCGSCTIVPALDILFPATNPLPLPIPCDPLLVGADLYTQWLLLKPSDCPILPDFAFSNALRFTVGE